MPPGRDNTFAYPAIPYLRGPGRCVDVPATALPQPLAALGATGLWFQIDEHGALASVQVTRRDRAAATVSEAFARLQARLTADAGAPAKRDGSAAPDVLASAALRQAVVEYRFADYRALVRATNMGDGFVFTEEYTRLD